MGGTESGPQLEMRRSRLRKLAVATSLAGALFLVLSVSGFAAAARTDPPAPSLVLQQLLNGQVQCTSPDATCTVVNLYGPDGSPNPPLMFPGDQRMTTVQLRNAGTVPSSGLVVSAGACTNQPLSGGADGGDLCPVLTVAIACTTGSMTFSFGPETLTRFGQAGVLTINNGLAVGQAATCTFTTTYPATAPSFAQVLRVIQPVAWTITAEAPPPPPPPTTTPPTTAPPTTAPPTTAPPTSAPPTSAPPVTAPPATAPPSAPSATVPPSAAVTPPSAAVPSQVAPAPSAPSRLAFTGGDALPWVLTGLALLLLGALLFWLSRRRGHSEDAGVSLPRT